MPPPTSAAVCHVGPDFVPCDPAELAPLLAHLERGEAVSRPLGFPRGTLLPDGRLDLCKQGVGPEGTRAVAAALRCSPHVVHVLLGADGIGDVGARAVAELAGAHPGLQTVFLGCNYISSSGVEAMAKALHEHPGIRGLWLKRNPIGPAGARALAGLLAHSPGLRTLDLVNTDLGAQGLGLIAEALIDGRASVERLYLSGNRLTATEAPPLADLLRRNGRLRHLYLGVNRLGDVGVQALAEGLRANRTLRTLGLGSNGIGPEGAWALADALCAHPALERLDLGFEPSTAVLHERGNHVGDDGAAACARVLHGNRQLRTLDLQRNGITDEGLSFLIEALSVNRSVQAVEPGMGGSLPGRKALAALLRRNRAGSCWRKEEDPDVCAIRSVYRTARR
jgi:Ran GTPase-activating protein (RanGAP) involved in mRNA processing and transport